MKLSTLLLSSAALVVAGSSYAADLPAKKGAPAAKAATGCPAFGAGYFQIPGSDTCLKFGGYMRNTSSFDGSALTNTPAARVEFTAMSNSEIGAVKGYARTNFATDSASADRMYVSVGGFTAGAQGNLGDIAGTNPIGTISGLGGGSATGFTYAMPIGSSTLSVGAFDAPTDGDGKASQDLVAQFATTAAGAKLTAFAANHPNDVGQGWAVGGKVSFAAGVATINVAGGISNGAIAYTGTSDGTSTDSDGTDMYAGSTVSGEVLLAAGPGTLYAGVGQVTADADTVQYYAVGYNYTLAKNLVVTPEWKYSNDSSDTSATAYVLRIERDF